MPIQTPSRTVRALSAGAALATASLASAGVSPPLVFSSINAATAILNLGSTTGTLSFTGPATVLSTTLTIAAGSGYGSANADHYAGMDVFGASLTTFSSYTAGLWTVTFDLNVNRTVSFSDLESFGSPVANWTVDSVAVANGDLISAGTHVFTGTFIYSGPPIALLQSGFGLVGASSAVPLPGAAGLAAVGLAGLSRRRRR